MPLVIDVAGLQAWQWIMIVLAGLGFSAVPWIGGLAFGRIQFTKQATETWTARIADLVKNHDARVADLEKHHQQDLQERADRYAEMKESRDGYKIATKEERERADRATDALGQMVEAIEANTHVVRSLNEIADRAAPERS